MKGPPGGGGGGGRDMKEIDGEGAEAGERDGAGDWEI
jgi:hypothetical protein